MPKSFLFLFKIINIIDFEGNDFSANYFEMWMQTRHLHSQIAFLEVQKCQFDYCPEPELKWRMKNLLSVAGQQSVDSCGAALLKTGWFQPG